MLYPIELRAREGGVKRITREPGDKHEFAENFPRVLWCALVPHAVARDARHPRQLLLPVLLAVTKRATAWERRVTLSLPKMFAR